MTRIQKNKVFCGIHDGSITTLIGTNRSLFFDRANLTNITIHKPSSWAYSSQSDPRYNLLDVAHNIANVYTAKLILV